MTEEQLQIALTQHAAWLSDNSQGRRLILSKANLSGLNLAGADLCRAIFQGTLFRETNLSGANVQGADFSFALLRDADLTGVNLAEAKLDDIKKDFMWLAGYVKDELLAVKAAIIAGVFDGGTYRGDCCCLVGMVAKMRGYSYDHLCKKPDGIPINPFSMRECWMATIRPNDTPAANPVASITVNWIDEALALKTRSN